MTIGRAVVAVPAQHRRPARRRDDEDGVRPAGPVRLLLRRVGGALAVAVPRRAARLHRRPGRRDGARRQGHVPARRHPQRRRPRPALPDRQEHRVPAGEHVPRQRARTARSSSRSTRCGPSASARRSPTSTTSSSTCASTRGSRSTSGRTPNAADPARQGPGRRATAGCTWSASPDQIVPIVCGGLGSLHAIALPSFGESQMQSKPCSGPLTDPR